MEYITGIQALNIPCSLDTTGDWHRLSINWERPNLRKSEDSVLGDWGIEQRADGTYFANTLRAIVDLIADGNFSEAQGARDDFICNSKYHKELFEHVILLPGTGYYDFMCKEFGKEWWTWYETNKPTRSCTTCILKHGTS